MRRESNSVTDSPRPHGGTRHAHVPRLPPRLLPGHELRQQVLRFLLSREYVGAADFRNLIRSALDVLAIRWAVRHATEEDFAVLAASAALFRRSLAPDVSVPTAARLDVA